MFANINTRTHTLVIFSLSYLKKKTFSISLRFRPVIYQSCNGKRAFLALSFSILSEQFVLSVFDEEPYSKRHILSFLHLNLSLSVNLIYLLDTVLFNFCCFSCFVFYLSKCVYLAFLFICMSDHQLFIHQYIHISFQKDRPPGGFLQFLVI